MKTSVCGYSHTDSPTSCSKSIRWLSPLKRKTMPSWRSPSRSTRSETPESTSMFTVPGSRMPARTVSWISRRLRISTTVDSMSCVASRWESMRPAGPAPMMATWVVMVLRATVFLACRGSLVDVQLVEEREQVVERLEQILVVPDHRRARCDRGEDRREADLRPRTLLNDRPLQRPGDRGRGTALSGPFTSRSSSPRCRGPRPLFPPLPRCSLRQGERAHQWLRFVG